jgi:hypothetical protein
MPESRPSPREPTQTMRLHQANSSKYVTCSVLQHRHPPQHCRGHRLPRRGVSRWSRTGRFPLAGSRVRQSGHPLLRTLHTASLMGASLACQRQESRLNTCPAQAVFPGPLHRGWKKAQIERAHRTVTREAKATAMTKLGRRWPSPGLV